MLEAKRSPDRSASPHWPLLGLAAALIWVVLMRAPLILNAETHLDSDLAVDGLTLIEGTHGHFRWHFPGTPHIGTGPVWLALPTALIFGAKAWTLVLGGVIAYECVVVATFVLAWRLFGRVAAMASLVPLAFASVGTVWLSGRLSGGHLLTLAWYSATLCCFHAYFTKGGTGRAFLLGLASGLGFYLDSMFLAVLPAMALVSVFMPSPDPTIPRKLLALLVFVIGFAIGDLPREIGYRMDPYDSYGEQFSTILVRHASGPLEGEVDRAQTRKLAIEHLRILGLECLPRLLTGHSLSSSQIPRAPNPDKFMVKPKFHPRSEPTMTSILTVALVACLVLPAILILASKGFSESSASCRGTIWVLFLTSGTVLLGFVINRNIFNSDNYRYLVFLLVPWTVGFGALMDAIWRRGSGGRVASILLFASVAACMTLDTRQWYESYGWVDGIRPVAVPLSDPALDWLREHPEADAIFGDYWDVYRLAFLRGGNVRGLPFPVYPDRYNAAKDYAARRPETLIGRRGHFGDFYSLEARKDGGTVLFREGDVTIMNWPTKR